MSTEIPVLPSVPVAADELATLTHFLDFFRAVARRKADGLSDEQLRQRLPGHPSTLTIGGLLYHLASVEDWWFTHVIGGAPVPEPWHSAWSAGDDDADFRADGLSGAEILAQHAASCASSRRVLDAVTDPDQPTHERHRRSGEAYSVRWVLVHVVEEYARHCGHLDLLREAVDGITGD